MCRKWLCKMLLKQKTHREHNRTDCNCFIVRKDILHTFHNAMLLLEQLLFSSKRNCMLIELKFPVKNCKNTQWHEAKSKNINLIEFDTHSLVFEQFSLLLTHIYNFEMTIATNRTFLRFQINYAWTFNRRARLTQCVREREEKEVVVGLKWMDVKDGEKGGSFTQI